MEEGMIDWRVLRRMTEGEIIRNICYMIIGGMFTLVMEDY